ncbi:energy-coupling factor ABC transporter permease [Methanococcus voltae]|uniref:Putative cobalt transport protein CbiM n=2 Tax=Methanococcus voltae TaxID=2188 RepID=A0A8J7UTI0_METVO|nr:energy-coupling factor ABC transporter permease [Methanococcus voltae]MBP2172892.1 cobalt/nickel transport system permease protein [Methanococcus voltae]MBP2201698.1 cobalt/nickel transport system permease protein [Methanococcus voltae]MCS3922486.1 cobalt/nickel transport system permease protein [Methanococcus voltae PS]
MHIMEGYLPVEWAIVWYIISAIVVGYGIMNLNKVLKNNPEAKPLLAISAAFMFVLSSLKLPSVSGSCSHPTGNGLGVILFGPAITSVLATIVLLFQALVLAHGGLSTLGANIFSMGIMGPFVGYLVFKALRGKLNITWVVVLTAIFADWATYLTTSVQLALAFPNPSFMSSFTDFGTIFAITQIPLAIAEGLITGLLWDYLSKLRPELFEKVMNIKKGGNNE